ncbi:hypothetical protein B0H14DRAFT_3526834 [Mycena olivaceomarginata]|nr:hypothetical protein B0H14DRAFT_3526834 [Mycena olivaceomarginata]
MFVCKHVLVVAIRTVFFQKLFAEQPELQGLYDDPGLLFKDLLVKHNIIGLLGKLVYKSFEIFYSEPMLHGVKLVLRDSNDEAPEQSEEETELTKSQTKITNIIADFAEMISLGGNNAPRKQVCAEIQEGIRGARGDDSGSPAPNQSSDDDGMYEEPPVAIQKEKPQRKSISVSALPTQTRCKYLPKSIALDDDSDIEPDIVKPRKSTSRAPLRILSDTEENELAPKARSKARSATDEADDTSQSADEEKSVDNSAISGEDDGLGGGSDEVQRQLLAERPHVINKASAAGDYDPAHLPKLYSHHRKSSTSSRGSSLGGSEFNHPEDTDPDDNDLARPEDLDDKDEDRPVQLKAKPRYGFDKRAGRAREVPLSSFRKGQKKSAQQEKYDAEQPKIRQTKSRSRDTEAETTTEDIVLNEIEWHQDCCLHWPPNRGPLKLLDQTPIVQDVIRDAIKIGICEIATEAAYRPVPLRSVAAQELIGRAAKNLELSHSHIRAMVRALHADYKYIFPYNPAHPFDPPGPPAPAPPAPNGQVVPAHDSEAMPETPMMRDRDDTKYFKLNSPFLAAAFAHVIHDVWFSGPKANSFKPDYIKAMVSHDPNRSNERELPAPMICLVGADVRIVLLHGFGLISPTFRSTAASLAYSTGSYVLAPKFSQSRLEGIYLAHMATIEENCRNETPNEQANAQAFHKVMHQLYLNAT